jgi:hypothetical protein
MIENIGPAPANWPIPKTTLAIWHPIPSVPAYMRYRTPHWAFFWGSLVLRRLAGQYGFGDPNFQWNWYPDPRPEKSHIPQNLMQQFVGNWSFSDDNMGDTAVLRFGKNGGEFARLEHYLDVVGYGASTHTNDEVSLSQVCGEAESNGLLDGHKILWMLTEFHSS